ncbi:hypothetical protein ACFFRE_02060 [Aciditerrimonas ferrireducens]|uniref:Helix-turn-helix domain-containing protein n=1 Tax=Aciditerrimonas ferrireducens TaxID=667306 RepID=A0ABV6C1W2_9ACTN
MNGFVPIRVDAPTLLPSPGPRRDGYRLAALHVGAALAEDVDWRTNELTQFRSVAFARAEGLSWRRVRRALGLLETHGALEMTLRPFRAGRLRLPDRSAPGSLLHAPGSPERFVPIAKGALRALRAEHQLDWVETGLLLALLLLCDQRGELPDREWTKTRLCDHVGVGWRRLTRALNRLTTLGLVSVDAQRGQAMQLTLHARAALVAPTAPSAPKRAVRRHLERSAARAGGPARRLADQLLRHHRLGEEPSPGLLQALAAALSTGASERSILERLAAKGHLTGALDPLAVLVARARQVTDELKAAQAAEARRRAQLAADQARHATLRAATDEQLDRTGEESRWLAAILPRIPTSAELDIPELLATRPALLAGHLHATAQQLIERWPNLDPAALLERWATRPASLDAFDPSGLPYRRAEHGPPGTLPRRSSGPKLTERLTTA